MSEEEYIFTCKECGSHDLRVVWQYLVITHYFEILECNCGENDIAAERNYQIIKTYKKWGILDEMHRWDEEEKEEIDSDENEEDREIFCRKCFDDAIENGWDVTDEDSEIDEDSYEFYVYCNRCDREIEFGWSHPYRGGRIWPAECTDFNPWKCWPEPRYKKIGLKKAGLDLSNMESK